MANEASNNINNAGATPNLGGNFDSNTASVSQRIFSSLTTNARHVIARSEHSDTLEVEGYDPALSIRLSTASAQNDNFKNRIALNTIAKELLSSYGEEFEMDIENAYYNFKNGIPHIKGLETGVIFMGCLYRGEKLGRLKIYNPKTKAKKDSALIEEDIDANSHITDDEDEEEILAVLSGDDAKYELRNRAEIYYDSVNQTIPDESEVILEEYISDIN